MNAMKVGIIKSCDGPFNIGPEVDFAQFVPMTTDDVRTSKYGTMYQYFSTEEKADSIPIETEYPYTWWMTLCSRN